MDIMERGSAATSYGLSAYSSPWTSSTRPSTVWPRGSSARRNAQQGAAADNLENTEELKELELDADFTARLALTEEDKTLPFGAIWDYYCLKEGVPVGEDWLKEVRDYEKNVMSAPWLIASEIKEGRRAQTGVPFKYA